MKTIRIAKGYNLQLGGRPSTEVESLPEPARLALLPEHIPFIKPRLLVAVGQTVRQGTPLIEDKRNASVRFLSPGGGRIAEINFGHRRVIQEIVIERDAQEQAVAFESIAESELETFPRKRLIEAILAGGLWPLIRQLPFRDYAQMELEPPMIIVGLGSLEPFQPLPEVYLAGKESLFEYGLTALKRLAPQVHVCAPDSGDSLPDRLSSLVSLHYSGPYPAHDPGVILYRVKKSPEENRAWYIAGQDVLLLAHLLKTGTYPTERDIVLAGPSATTRKHFRTRLGVPLADITAGRREEGDIRHIEGGVLSGFVGSDQTYLGFYESAVNLLPEGNRKGELLGLFRPGYRRPSYSRTFISKLNKNDLVYDCNIHGGDRACIACGYCAQVCPVDILPQFAYKSILAGEVEESLEHGLLDCVECGLCSYVCPSKIELAETLHRARVNYYIEQSK
ncbi:MAG: hypothetical protein AMJ54_05425 [Deltaproteobacteria bacterium SG8_13]|nr:MAG: hypothetical protein AMJ54_05425 [Deltaproteobacteria bacterium SG8_13]